MAAISSLRAELTSLCRFNEFLPANSGETMRVEKAWPHPPVSVFTSARKMQASRDKMRTEEAVKRGHGDGRLTRHISDVDMNGMETFCNGRLE